MNWSEKIIEFCLSNRVSTTEVADALGKAGVLPKVQPINTNFYRVGPVKTVFTAQESHELIFRPLVPALNSNLQKSVPVPWCIYL